MLLMINTNVEKISAINAVTLFLSDVFVYLVFVFCLSFCPHLYAQDYNRASVSLGIDNDGLVGRDYGYTHGLVIKANSRVDNNIETYMPVPVQRIAAWLLLNKNTKKAWGVSLGQKIWTPRDIRQVREQKNDRPYAGLLFFKTRLFEYSSILSHKYSLLLGVIGPKALAEQSQVTVHRAIGLEKPRGWQQQIDNQFVFSFAYERQTLLWRSAHTQNRQYDLAMASHATLGNFQNEVAITSTLRWGTQLEQNFASASLTQGDFVDESVFTTSKQSNFIYLAIEGRYRYYDITLEGDRPSHAYEVNTQSWQSSIAVGLVSYRQSWGASLTFIASTPDYQEDIKSYNATAAFKVFYRI
jgi:hypothetical protein